MHSAAKILNTLNEEEIKKVSPIALESAIQGLSRFLENKGVASDLPQLSETDINQYRQDIKTILTEENISQDKHDVLIDCYVDYLNYYLQNSHKITANSLGKRKKCF